MNSIVLSIVAWCALFARTGQSQDLASSATTPEFTGEIKGIVFFDANRDGMFDLGEKTRSGVSVGLMTAKGKRISEQSTQNKGNYGFGNLAPGIYFLRFTFGTDFSVRTAGIRLTEESSSVYLPMPVITPESNYNYAKLGLMNPDNVDTEEVSPFAP